MADMFKKPSSSDDHRRMSTRVKKAPNIFDPSVSPAVKSPPVTQAAPSRRSGRSQSVLISSKPPPQTKASMKRTQSKQLQPQSKFRRSASVMVTNFNQSISASESKSSKQSGIVKLPKSKQLQKSKASSPIPNELPLVPKVEEECAQKVLTLRDAFKRPIPDVAKWSCTQVSVYFQDYFPLHAHVFEREKIDGACLLLMKRDDIVYKMGVPIGHSLKMLNHIIMLQTGIKDVRQSWR